MKIGDNYEEVLTISAQIVREFAQITGDTNPIHIDEKYASTTKFERPIVHGALMLAQLSRVLGTVFPGNGTILLNQQVSYLKAVPVGAECILRIEVTSRHSTKPVYTLKTDFWLSEIVITGQSTVLILHDE